MNRRTRNNECRNELASVHPSFQIAACLWAEWKDEPWKTSKIIIPCSSVVPFKKKSRRSRTYKEEMFFLPDMNALFRRHIQPVAGLHVEGFIPGIVVHNSAVGTVHTG